MKPMVPTPFSLAESLTLDEAVSIAGCGRETLRRWASLYHVGRKVGGQWRLSRVALAMHLDGERSTLRKYLSGDRRSDDVRGYFRRFDIKILETA